MGNVENHNKPKMKYNSAFTWIMSLEQGKKKADWLFLRNAVDILNVPFPQKKIDKNLSNH